MFLFFVIIVLLVWKEVMDEIKKDKEKFLKMERERKWKTKGGRGIWMNEWI